ncbi:pilus assembly PilX family protein [Desulfogranum mediterraneum]|uniref:pilus assembly PilX family protein n=1 Tax=Desulfogranum mediterraneum TaxID=160661 RepID=UPI0003F611D9|nr:PilX N-terminal domain-containing pilus assembly protein [Desulfogranum mediterraneum]
MTAYKLLHRREGRGEHGFVLVTALIMLLVLTILGIMAIQTSVVELMISGNDKTHKQTFYQADGGTELAQQLIFENAICTTTKNGFTETLTGTNAAHLGNTIVVEVLQFSDTNPASSVVSDTNREFVYYPYTDINDPSTAATFNTRQHTNFLVQSAVQVNPGSGMQMVSGYEGLGAGSAGGGTSRLYTIAAQHFGLANSQSTITVRWRLDNFLISSAAAQDCKY